MKEIKARIKWIRGENGRRIVNLPRGTLYYPTLRICNSMIENVWSVRFSITDEFDLQESDITFSLLIDSLESNLFSENLTSGTQFCLFEGNHVVATGIVY